MQTIVKMTLIIFSMLSVFIVGMKDKRKVFPIVGLSVKVFLLVATVLLLIIGLAMQQQPAF